VESEKALGDRALEVLAALVLGLATVATAWCAYQATRWNDEETDLSRVAGQARLEASRLFGLGSQKVSYDATSAALYAQAIADGNEELQQFLLENLIRPEFLPVIEQWRENAASDDPEPLNLFENEEYIEEQLGPSREADQRAEDATRGSQEASDNAEGFVQTTIFLASALFFAGVTANFRARTVRLLLLFTALVLFAVGVARIAELPFA
jgi:hypothetical protein